MSVRVRQVLVAVAAAAAVALSPQRGDAQGREVAGTYNTTIASPQGAIKAVIVLKRDNGTLGGTLAADGFPVFPITSATPSDSGLKIQADTPDGGVTVALKFGAGDKVSGTVVYQGTEMGVDGTFAGAGGASTGAMTSPVGVYVLRTTEPMLGAPNFEATCTITKSATGAYGGTCGNADVGDVPVSSVAVEGSVVTFGGDTPAGQYRIVLTMSGTEGTGTMTVGTESAKTKATFTAR